MGEKGGGSLKSVSSQITLFPSSRAARPLYKTSPYTSLGKQTLNISVRTLLHKTPGTEKKDNHTRVLALALRPSPFVARSQGRWYARVHDAAGRAFLRELFFETRSGKKITPGERTRFRVARFLFFEHTARNSEEGRSGIT